MTKRQERVSRTPVSVALLETSCTPAKPARVSPLKRIKRNWLTQPGTINLLLLPTVHTNTHSLRPGAAAATVRSQLLTIKFKKQASLSNALSAFVLDVEQRKNIQCISAILIPGVHKQENLSVCPPPVPPLCRNADTAWMLGWTE